ncbi:MAG: ankyrin repeat domain-containing protein [Erysipelotrichaceae bacterium]|nr:ankyrin repeat domain-containing protein [Erysipelotrichaceae bacterium]MBQ2658389.1 ankyrin repeat domain-containing protein [Erysipelotrichaceae bacterium]MBQ6494250.1 ankyrin repeat domain-containing protein [Erysipelotrichaceae bacterium]MBQ6494297.1 ankyrin repeat domain-containing protein [Erysipelotrichaceae bacterium]
MKKLFTAIRKSDLETIKQIIEKKPELVNCTAKQPPKKDDGQSPLQVALKTGNTAIANYLLDNGADVNFIEDGSCCNQWRTPVLHDAINCAVMLCRWNTDDQYMGFRVFSTKERAEEGLAVLKRMLVMGADVNALDSYGNSGLNRFALQAKQILPSFNYAEHCEGKDRVFTDELHEDLKKVLQALKDAGADPSYKAPNLGYSVREFCSEGSISILFEEVFG